MTSYGQVRQWTAKPLEDIVRLLNHRESVLVALNDDVVNSQPFSFWWGCAAEKATKTYRGLVSRIEDLVGSVAAVRRLTADIADRIEKLERQVADTERAADEARFRIDDNGIPVPLRLPKPAEAAASLIDFVRLLARVQAVMETASAIDNDYAFVLDRVADGAVDVADNAGSLSAAASAGGVEGSVLHARLLDKFHVEVDDRSHTLLGGIVSMLAGTDESSRLTRGEADLILGLGPGGAIELRDLSGDAINEAADRFPHAELLNDEGDAFRHAYWNALMTWAFGDEFATSYGTAHEQVEGDPVSHAMDLHNNEVGRNIATANPTADPSELADLVFEAVNNGRTVEITNLGELAPTNDSSHSPTSPHIEAPQSVRPGPYQERYLHNLLYKGL